VIEISKSSFINYLFVLFLTESLDKGTAKKILDAEKFRIHVIPLDYLDSVLAGGDSVDLISQLAISLWETDDVSTFSFILLMLLLMFFLLCEVA
jgi:hypothetical protein